MHKFLESVVTEENKNEEVAVGTTIAALTSVVVNEVPTLRPLQPNKTLKPVM